MKSAENSLLEALKLEPDNAVYRYILGQVQYMQDNLLEAKNNLEIVSRSRISQDKGEEYNSKLKEFQDKQETMPEGVKKMRVAEIQEVESRVTNYRQVAYQEIQKKQQELFVPIRDKVTKAINDVAVEGKYTYILDLGSQAVIYKSPTSNDITAKVKAKLGLK